MPRQRDEELLRAVGARMQKIRQQAGMTQEQLAEAIEIQPVTVSRFETGHRALSISVLAEVARALSTTVGDLVDVTRPVPRLKKLKGETELLRTWRNLDDGRRDLVLNLVRELSK